MMRILCSAIIVPPLAFWKEFDIPRSVRKDLLPLAGVAAMLRDMFGDVRMLCHDTGLMNPIAKILWRICKINGRRRRYRSERSGSTWSASPRDLCHMSSPSRVAATGPVSTHAR